METDSLLDRRLNFASHYSDDLVMRCPDDIAAYAECRVSMTTVNVTDRDGVERQIKAKPGASLMEALRDQEELGVVALCGGICSCATCHVYVDDAWRGKLPAAQSGELELLADTPDNKPESRLSCQIKMLPAYDGLRVTVAPDG